MKRAKQGRRTEMKSDENRGSESSGRVTKLDREGKNER